MEKYVAKSILIQTSIRLNIRWIVLGMTNIETRMGLRKSMLYFK